MTAIVILSMALSPLVTLVLDRLMPPESQSMDGVDRAHNLEGRVLIIGFGRFAQVVSQPLLARGIEVSLIEIDVEMIQAAGNFGFKVFYGDGTRLDVLRASGAARAEAILVCVDKPEVADRIVRLCKAEFPLAKLFVRAFDRGHALRLVHARVDYQVRETFESAMAFGRAVLVGLGVDATEADDIMDDVRKRDEVRFEFQIVDGIKAGRFLLRGNMVTPEPAPLVTPRQDAEALNAAAASLIAEKEAERESS
jgi:glutathione-regulated potassium-efflux system protein KefB